MASGGRLVLVIPCLFFIRGASMVEFVDELLDPAKYDNRVRPGVDSGDPVTVFLDMYVVSIGSIDEVKMEYSMSIFMRQRWIDDRLKFTQYKDDITLNYNLFDRLWVPDLFVKNEKKATFHTITVPNRLIKVSPNGQIYYSQRLTMTLNCDMHLKYYPMDNQTCLIELESYGYTTRDIVFKWKVDGDPVQIPSSLQMPEFELTEVATGDCTVEYITGSFTCLYASFQMKRQFEYYLIQTFVPSCLIVSLSWVSFWIDIHAVPARVTLGLLTVLTMTTQSSGISSRLPRVSYIKAIDVWMTCCLVFVFGALIEYSIVNVLARKEEPTKIRYRDRESEYEEEKEDQEEAEQVWSSGKFTPNPDAGPIHSSPSSPECASVSSGHMTTVDIRSDTQIPPVWKDTPVTGDSLHPTLNGGIPKPSTDAQRSTRKKKPKPTCWGSCWNRMRRHPAVGLDIISRLLFPSIFIVFNIIYWIHYKVKANPVSANQPASE